MMASGVAGGSTASVSSGGASASSASRTAAKDDGGTRDDDGFAGVLANSSTGNTPASDPVTTTPEPRTPPVAAGDEQTSPLADEAVDKGLDQDNLPDQILALLGGTWATPATAATPKMAAIPPASADGPDSAAIMLAADPAALLASPASADTALAKLATADTVGTARKLPAPLLGSHTLAGSTAPAESALPVADFARALGLAAAKGGSEFLPVSPAAGATADSIEFALPGAQVAATSPIRATAEAIAATPIPMPADPDAGFDDALGTRIGWLADQRIGRAEIRVSPDHLGPIDVRLHIDGSRVSAEFTSANSDVRQALEASVGRLRDMLEQQGLQLAQSDVGSRQSNNPGGHLDNVGSDLQDGDIADTANLSTTPVLRRGLLDEYA